MRKIMLCQFSNQIINPPSYPGHTTAAEFMYSAQWLAKKSYGYWKPEHFWELPLWIGEVMYAMRGHHDVELHVVTDLSDPLPDADAYCFSALEVNKKFIQNYAKRHNKPFKQFYVGGYVDPEYFDDCGSIEWCTSVKHLCNLLDIPYEYGVDWSLFSGTECIPRLTMSYGCSHNCKFCTVPNEVKEVEWDDVLQQVTAMKRLKFKLVYLNDKTWGMSENRYNLAEVYRLIKEFNPDFDGFIVQSSVCMIQSLEGRFYGNEIDLMKTLHIKMIELGIETFNDHLLKKYCKPQREESINHVVKMLSERGFHVIVNIMLGLPGEARYTYFRTLGWLTMNFEHLFGVNIYTLAVYEEAPLGKEMEHDSYKDRDELSEDRTFWTDQERRDFQDMKDKFYALGSQIWCERRINAPIVRVHGDGEERERTGPYEDTRPGCSAVPFGPSGK